MNSGDFSRPLIGGLLLCLAACTNPGETTGLAASTGGVIGAGLGAIVGSQTGSAGEGVAIGAVAGAATGALIGNSLEAQQQQVKAQNEKIERQQGMLTAQQSEISELRRAVQDPNAAVKPAAMYRPVDVQARLPNESMKAVPQPAKNEPAGVADSASGSAPMPATNNQNRADAAPQGWPAEPEGARAGMKWSEPERAADKARSEDVKPAKMVGDGSSQCKSAEEEMKKAGLVTENSDKLFHYRRALRLCPEVAGYHNALGELYLKLNRPGDAEFEFKETLRLDPKNSAAAKNLAALKK